MPEVQTVRKIIQISQSACENTSVTQCNWILHALCDDGTVWAMTSNSDFGQVDTSTVEGPLQIERTQSDRGDAK